VSLALGRQHRRLTAALRPGRFDLVHYHALWTPALPLQAFAYCSAPRVVTFHDTPPGAFGRAILRAASRILLPRIDEVIAVSDAPRAHLHAGPEQLVRIVPPCTDLRRFTPTPSPSPPTAPPGETVTLLFVGRLEPRKGAMLLLEGYRRLCADGLRVRLVIAGSGGEEPALRRFVARHRLPDVTFLGRFDEAEAPNLYAACDIACAPSPYGESFGIVVAEAMASGRPVVAAANRGYRTLLTGEAAEMLAPPGDAEGLYRRLRRLVLDPSLRARLGAWGLAASKSYDCRNVASTIVEIYRAAMTSSRRASVGLRTWTPSPDLVAENPDLVTSQGLGGD
jgi:phosphatidylinositol alpha-mannosyltransferase